VPPKKFWGEAYKLQGATKKMEILRGHPKKKGQKIGGKKPHPLETPGPKFHKHIMGKIP